MRHLTRRNGSISGFELYEITERDLRFLRDHTYKVGNVLLFASESPKVAALGHECACAENERAARQYIASISADSQVLQRGEHRVGELPQDEILKAAHTAAGHAQTVSLQATPLQAGHANDTAPPPYIKEHYEKVVEGLNERVAALQVENESLKAAISERTARIESLSLSLLTSDKVEESLHEEIANISTLQSGYHQELEEAEQARYLAQGKLAREQERAMHLEADIVVFQSDLATAWEQIATLEATLAAVTRTEQAVHAISTSDQEDVFQTADGVVRVYHEFMPVPRKSEFKHTISLLRNAAWVIVAAFVIGYIFFTASIFDTMRASGVPVSDFSDAIIIKIGNLFGF